MKPAAIASTPPTVDAEELSPERFLKSNPSAAVRAFSSFLNEHQEEIQRRAQPEAAEKDLHQPARR